MLYAVCNLYTYPQTVTFEHLTVENGLAHNSGLCIAQDRDGFLWIGTQSGLSRYDGYNFKNYTHQPGDSTSLSGSYINSLYVDNSGVLWIGTNKGGLNRFNRHDESFTNYKNDTKKQYSIGDGAVYGINEDRFGNLWIAVNPSGLFFFDRESKKFHHFQDDPDNPYAISGKRAYTIFRDSKDDLWIGTDGGLNKMLFLPDSSSTINYSYPLVSGKKIQFIHWENEPGNSESLIKNEVLSIYEDNSKIPSVLWLGTWGGLSSLQFNTNGKAVFDNQNNLQSIGRLRIWSLYKEDDNSLLIGTVSNGLIQYYPETGRFINYQSNKTHLSGFSGFTVRTIFKDNSGVLFFGTENNGINKFVSKKKKFNVYSHNTEVPFSLSFGDVTAVYENKDRTLWVGTRLGGLNRLDEINQSSGRFSHYIYEPNNSNSISHNHIRCIYEDSMGILWIASWNIEGGLNRYDKKTNQFIRYQNNPYDSNSLSDNQVRSIIEDKNGDLWIGTAEAGLDKFIRVTETFRHYKHTPSNPKSLSDNSVMNLYIDKSGILWIPTFNGGLNKYNRVTDDFTHYKFDSSNPFSINHNRVWTCYEDKAGRFWVATDGGLNLLNRETDEFIHFTEDNGLSNNSVFGILEDEQGNMWLSTSNGLSKCIIESADDFYSTRIRFINYDNDDNLLSVEFTSSAFYKGVDGKMYFGGVGGLTWFFPDSIINNSHIPPVAITSFKVFEKEIELDSAITEKKLINLSYKQNFISLEFAALDFQASDKNQYAFKLEGVNDDWINIRNRRYVSFSNLDPGIYKFSVKVSNNDGLWNEEGTSLSIIVHPPFWMTNWFRILSGTFLFVSFILLIRYISTQQLKKKLRTAEIQQKLQGERERISRELHDSIGANLTSIITGLEISKRFLERNDKESLNENISTLEGHTRKTIEELRQTIWSLHQDISCISELAEKVKDHFRGKIKDVEINIDTKFDTEAEVSSLESLNLFRIIQEAVNNSIKYSECSLVNICFKSNSDILEVSVKDNGKGFDVNEILSKKHSYGIANMKKRTSQINAEFKITSEPGKGTKIVVIKSTDV